MPCSDGGGEGGCRHALLRTAPHRTHAATAAATAVYRRGSVPRPGPALSRCMPAWAWWATTAATMGRT